jgi:hypothetical protein
MSDDIWIGLAHVIPHDRNSNILKGKGNRGAYVNVVGQAASIDIFKERIVIALQVFDLNLIEIEDVEKFNQRIKSYEVDASLIELVKQLKDDYLIKFGKFHAYPI